MLQKPAVSTGLKQIPIAIDFNLIRETPVYFCNFMYYNN